jgi:hypothetical protein
MPEAVLQRATTLRTATIAEGAEVSDAQAYQSNVGGSLQLPAAISGTELSYEVSLDGSTWGALRNAAGATIASVSVSGDDIVRLPAELAGFPQFRIKLNLAQAAARTILLAFKA